MPWNYRVMRHARDGEQMFAVTEVYYNDDLSVFGWVDPREYSAQCSESVDDLKGTYQFMIEAFDKPVLEETELPGYRQ